MSTRNSVLKCFSHAKLLSHVGNIILYMCEHVIVWLYVVVLYRVSRCFLHKTGYMQAICAQISILCGLLATLRYLSAITWSRSLGVLSANGMCLL